MFRIYSLTSKSSYLWPHLYRYLYRVLQLSRTCSCTQSVVPSLLKRGVFNDDPHLGRSRNLQADRCSQTYTNAAVATDAEQCSRIGVEILQQGGNAVDAAIAAMLSVGIINLHSTGIGGGGFMVIYDSSSKMSCAIDFRDKAPLNATTYMYCDLDAVDEPASYGIIITLV